MNPDDSSDLVFVQQMPFCVDYMDEYRLTLTSFGPTPNHVRQYLRQRFIYSLAEVMGVRIPLPLLSSVAESDADTVRLELERLGAEVQVTCEQGGPDDGSHKYPGVRIGFVYSI
jgi:hypothetical protein